MKTDVSWVNVPLKESENENLNEECIDSTDGNQHRKKRRLTTSSDTEFNDEFDENIWNKITDTKQWIPFADYISECRINMNVRQVLKCGEKTLDSSH